MTPNETLEPGDDKAAKSWWKHPVWLAAFVGSTVILAGLCFGFLHTFTALPVWACVFIALPAGAALFIFLLWLGCHCDTPGR